jgi:ferritin
MAFNRERHFPFAERLHNSRLVCNQAVEIGQASSTAKISVAYGTGWLMVCITIMHKSRIPQPVSAELMRQANQELAAAHSYLALSVWCDARNLKGFGQYFVKQAGEERAHAERLLKHLTDRGVTAEVAAVPAPKQDFRTLLEVAHQAQAQERANTLGINAVYEAALAAKDYPAQVLMHWFINEQVEEEDWSAEMVERVQAATCAGSLSDLDRHIERYLEQEVREVPQESK